MKHPVSTLGRHRGGHKTGHTSALATTLSILVIAIALILTVGGAVDLISQVAEATSFKAGLITLVLHLGLVLIGPALLVAYINFMPRERLPRTLETARIGAFATRSQAEPRHR